MSNISEVDAEEDEYVIHANVNKKLSKELNLSELIFDEPPDYNPPAEPGLANSNVIIPGYYHLHNNPSKIMSINYYEIIKDDIRNLRPLNKYQLEFVKNLSDEQKNELFELFNSCLETIASVL